MVGWAQFDIGSFLGGPVAADSGSIAAVSRIKDHMELWWIASDGSVQDDYWYPTQTPNWKQGELAPKGSATPSGGVAAISRKADHMEVWWISPAGSIEGSFFYDSIGHWQRYQLAPNGSAAQASAIYAQSRIPTVMNVWWIGTHGSIEGCSWIENATPSWERYQIDKDNSAALKSGLTAVSRIPTSEELWWIGPQGSVEGAYWYEDGNPWKRYHIAPLGSAAIGLGIKARSREPNVMNLWWIHTDGSVQGASTAVPAPWSRYSLSGPGSASPHSGLTALSRIPDSEELWWIGPKGEVKDAYWYAGLNKWNFFDLAPAGSARLDSNLASLARIRGSMELWYMSPQGTLEDRFWYDVPHYDFSIDVIECNTPRSRFTDTLYIAASVAIAGRDPIKISKALGDHEKGFTYPGIVFRDIPLADDEIAVFTYVIVNDGNKTEAAVLKILEGAATQLSTTGANAIAQAVGQVGVAAAGAAIGALVGSPVPIIGTIIGAGLGYLTSTLLGGLINSLNPDCDGPIGSAANTIAGSELTQKIESGQEFSHKDSNPGVDSPHGCGANSVYSTTWSVRRTPE